MSSALVDDIANEAAADESRCLRRAKTAHVTHYVTGLGSAAAAALAAYLTNVEGAATWATVSGAGGAVLAGIVTFMNPRSRAAFQYAQSADYGDLKRAALRALARSNGPGEAETDELSERLTELRRRVASDLQQTAT